MNFEAATRWHGKNRSHNILGLDFSKKPGKQSPLEVAIITSEGVPVLVMNDTKKVIPVYTPTKKQAGTEGSGQTEDSGAKDESNQLLSVSPSPQELLDRTLQSGQIATPQPPEEGWQGKLIKREKIVQEGYQADAIQNRIERQHNNNLRTLRDTDDLIER